MVLRKLGYRSVRPLPRAVDDAQHLDRLAPDPVRDDVRRHDELARVRPAAGTTPILQIGQKVDALLELAHHPACGRGAVLSDIAFDGAKVGLGLVQKLDPHGQRRMVTSGGGSSSSVPRLSIQRLVSSQATNGPPASALATALPMASTCQAFSLM